MISQAVLRALSHRRPCVSLQYHLRFMRHNLCLASRFSKKTQAAKFNGRWQITITEAAACTGEGIMTDARTENSYLRAFLKLV